MDKKDVSEFSARWNLAAEIHGKKFSDAAIGMAFRALQRYPLDDIRRALDAHVNNPDAGRFMPKPADIVRHIDGDAESRCLLAWSKVNDAMRHVGSYQSVVFDEPIVMCCIADMGGWIALCSALEKDMAFKRNEFVKRYLGYLNRAPEQHPGKLIGRIEQENGARFPEYMPEPVMIGNQETALAVYEKGESPGKQYTMLGKVKTALAVRKLQVVRQG